MKLNSTVGSIKIQIDTSRIDGNIKEAQKLLNHKIATDCEPLIPFQQGALRGSQTFPEGVYGGLIAYNTPYAHYIYVGDLYLTEDGRSWARKKEEKYPTGIPLNYHHPGTTDHWFESAKEQHLEEWIKLVKETVGKD